MTDNEKTKEELIREVAGIYKKLAKLEEPSYTYERPTMENLPDIVLPFLKGPSALFKEAADTFVLVGDSDGRIIYFNDVAEKISGYSAGEVMGKIGWELFMDSEEAERVKTLVNNNEVDQERKENIWIAKDGTRRIIKWLSYAEIGGGQYHIIKGIDISEHKNTLDSLKESREQYRMLFESMSEGFGIFEFVFGNEGQLVDAIVIEVNPALEKMFNADRNRVIGRSITEIFPNVVPDDFVRFCFAIDNREPLRFINMTAPRHKWFDIKAYSLENGNHYALVVRDISELKLMLEKLSASEERFYKAFHNSPEMMVLIRMSDDVFLETNQQFLDNLEYTREEILEIKQVKLLKPGQESYYEIILKDLSEQGTIKNVELQFLTKTGKVLTFLCSFQIMSLDDQSCRLVVLKDITKEKQLEKDLSYSLST